MAKESIDILVITLDALISSSASFNPCNHWVNQKWTYSNERIDSKKNRVIALPVGIGSTARNSWADVYGPSGGVILIQRYHRDAPCRFDI